MRRIPWAVVLAVVGGWVSGLSQLGLFLGIGRLIDRPSARDGVLVWLTAAAVIAALAAWAAQAGQGQGQARDEAVHRAGLVGHVFRLGPAERSRERTGRIVSTATDGVERAAAFRATFIGPMVASMTLPLLVLAVLALAVDPVAAGWLALGVPAIPVALGGFQAIFRQVSARYRAHARDLSAQFLDAIQGLPALRLLGAGPDMGRKLARGAEGLRRHVMRLLAGNQVVLFVVDAGFALAFVTLAAGLALTRYHAGHLTAGGAVSLVLAATLLLEPLDRIGQFFYVGMGGIAAAREITACLGEAPAVADPGGAAPAASGGAGGAPAVAFEGVGFAYDPAAPVLGDVTFALAPGDHAALAGPSGAGKTTVAALLEGTRRPDHGVVRLFGHDVTAVPLEWQRAQLAVVAQHTYLFTGTLRDNLRVADPTASDERLWAALAAADLSDFAATLPAGLDTAVGERGLALSGGQTQRLAIARAFLKDAPILVLDEPTAHVDLASERAILAALGRLAAGRTVLTISHRQAMLLDAGRVLRLERGVMAEVVR
ncbi:MAG: ABC transporter ATP-binding protein/permease [Propionibacteriaceae bacterium]|nr:ABC transporter ATP-binding protein/permease [Propionibacteriaceae bacterium]